MEEHYKIQVLQFATNAGLSSKYHHAQAKEHILHNDTNFLPVNKFLYALISINFPLFYDQDSGIDNVFLYVCLNYVNRQ